MVRQEERGKRLEHMDWKGGDGSEGGKGSSESVHAWE